MDNSTRLFIFSHVHVFHFVLVFFSLFSIASNSLGEERTGLVAFCMFVCIVCDSLCLFSSSWCQGLAATCHCGTPWTSFLLYATACLQKLSLLQTGRNNTLRLLKIQTTMLKCTVQKGSSLLIKLTYKAVMQRIAIYQS